MGWNKHGYVAVILLMGCFISSPFLVGAAWGETRYVSDMLIVSLRDGPGNEYSVVRTVKTDMAMEVIEEEGSFVKVRTEAGEEGWISKQYLTVNIPKSMLINNLNKEIATLKKEMERLEEQHVSLKSRLDSGSKDHATELKRLEDEIAKYKDDANETAKKLLDMTKKYDILVEDSHNVLTVTNERDRLQKENEALRESTQHSKKEMDELCAENQRLMRNEILHWFLAGSGVFFLGLLTGKLSRRKKHY